VSFIKFQNHLFTLPL
jgi:hypothetical protein